MIPVTTAREIVSAKTRLLQPVTIPFEQSVGYVLAAAIISPIDTPPFPQSSMDGYAIRFADKDTVLLIQDELPAGTQQELQLEPGKTIKVFTGGPVPAGADTIVQKEWVQIQDRFIQIQNSKVEKGMHIRIRGADIQKGAPALAQGTLINPMHIGFMASLGITEVTVISKPSVAILLTGNELVQPGHPLAFGQVYESNSFGLSACLHALDVTAITISHTRDTLAETEAAIANALPDHELVLITGGVSVGDYDHVAQACNRLGIEQHFHGIRQRPGKPLYFGTIENKWVFGLPGNPASVLSCFYQYVMPLLDAVTGRKSIEPGSAKLSASFDKKPPLSFFLKGYVEGGRVTVVPAQASFQQSSFADANCWIELPEETDHFEEGEQVRIYPFI